MLVSTPRPVPRRAARRSVLVVVLALAACPRGSGDDAPRGQTGASAPPVTRGHTQEAGASSAPARPAGVYMGRRIAPTMSHEGAEWLIRPEREQEEHAVRMLAELRLAPGDVACDVGAGNGYHTLMMARAVAPGGRAIAVDIQPRMLELLKERAAEQGVVNVEVVRGESADPKLEPGACDLVLMADVYHELDDPAGMLDKLRAALSRRGTLALLEFRAEDPEVPIKPEHTMSRAQILRELQASGYTLVRSFDGLPWQHLMFFAPSPR